MEKWSYYYYFILKRHKVVIPHYFISQLWTTMRSTGTVTERRVRECRWALPDGGRNNDSRLCQAPSAEGGNGYCCSGYGYRQETVGCRHLVFRVPRFPPPRTPPSPLSTHELLALSTIPVYFILLVSTYFLL